MQRNWIGKSCSALEIVFDYDVGFDWREELTVYTTARTR